MTCMIKYVKYGLLAYYIKIGVKIIIELIFRK
jgi:hypothetical protein